MLIDPRICGLISQWCMKHRCVFISPADDLHSSRHAGTREAARDGRDRARTHEIKRIGHAPIDHRVPGAPIYGEGFVVALMPRSDGANCRRRTEQKFVLLQNGAQLLVHFSSNELSLLYLHVVVTHSPLEQASDIWIHLVLPPRKVLASRRREKPLPMRH